MTDTEEVAKLVDGAYKNILEKFNPCARQLISAGKAYLKSLHGAVASSKSYLEVITKLARHAHQGTWGGSTDIGTALMQLVEVHKEIHAQQTNILKAFYVDLLLPLESNLEKDTKVVASEHKKFLHQHKGHQDAYQKALASCKKQKKRSRNSISHIDKDVKQLQNLEEEKKKLDGFCEESLKQAITQERRRYGFVLERQCSLAKHNLAYHTKGQALLQHNLEQWLEVVKTREFLPESIQKMFDSKQESRIGTEYASSCVLLSPISNQVFSCTTSPTIGMRKTQSIDASYLDLRDYQDAPYPRPLSRAKSDFNLTSSSASLVSSEYASSLRQKCMASVGEKSDCLHVRALYSYLSSGEHQLSFHEGDVIALIGDRNKGWQYGENLRNHRVGWFPIAYTEPVLEGSEKEEHESCSGSHWPTISEQGVLPSATDSPSSHGPRHSKSYMCSFTEEIIQRPARPHSTFADSPVFTIKDSSKMHHDMTTPVKLKQQQPRTPSHENHLNFTPTKLHHPIKELHETPQIFRSPRRSLTAPFPISVPPPNLPTSASLHSSNDSGFCNDTHPQVPSSTSQTPPAETQDTSSRENIFASVKLRKVVTNDRSAPMIT